MLLALFFSPLQEKCFHMGIGKRWKSEGAHFGVLSWSEIVFWSLLKKRVKKVVERSIPFFWIITYGIMPVITGKIWKKFHFIEHVAYIIDPKCKLIQRKLPFYITQSFVQFHFDIMRKLISLITQSHLEHCSWHITLYSQLYPFLLTWFDCIFLFCWHTTGTMKEF